MLGTFGVPGLHQQRLPRWRPVGLCSFLPRDGAHAWPVARTVAKPVGLPSPRLCVTGSPLGSGERLGLGLEHPLNPFRRQDHLHTLRTGAPGVAGDTWKCSRVRGEGCGNGQLHVLPSLAWGQGQGGQAAAARGRHTGHGPVTSWKCGLCCRLGSRLH